MKAQVRQYILALPPGEYSACGMTDAVHRASGGQLRPTPQIIEEVLRELAAERRAAVHNGRWQVAS